MLSPTGPTSWPPPNVRDCALWSEQERVEAVRAHPGRRPIQKEIRERERGYLNPSHRRRKGRRSKDGQDRSKVTR
eukprot:scaffold662_cov364-Pavlova_lutheri.AAC.41